METLDENVDIGNQPKEPPKAGKGKTIEQQYQKKTQLEHVLLRPDTYGTLLSTHC